MDSTAAAFAVEKVEKVGTKDVSKMVAKKTAVIFWVILLKNFLLDIKIPFRGCFLNDFTSFLLVYR